MRSPNDPSLKSWVDYDPSTDFPIQNLPMGVYSREGENKRVGVAIGEEILDAGAVYEAGLLSDLELSGNPFNEDSLNRFISHGSRVWRRFRSRISNLLSADSPELRDNADLRKRCLHRVGDCQLHIPVFIRDYVDFYSSEQHATNVGKLFRPDSPLMPNWKHMPVGYNGRASSVVVSGVDVMRPAGQTLPDGAVDPVFGPSRRLDFELELGFITGKDNPLGERVSTSDAGEFLFGMVIVNDWSARDIQRWEYQPLGPFLSKSFATSVSPWVVMFEALEPFRVSNAKQSPQVLPYLQCEDNWAFDIHLEVSIKSAKMSRHQRISKGNFRSMYWNVAQQLAHQSVNGTNVSVGDLYASGTISGDTPDSLGCLLEMTQGGKSPVMLEESGEQRRFLEDGDSVCMKAWCESNEVRIGFGEVEAKVLPCKE